MGSCRITAAFGGNAGSLKAGRQECRIVFLRPRSLIWVFLTVFCLFTALFAFSLFAGLIARSWGVVLASAATLAAMVLLYRFFAQSEVRSLAAYYKPIFKSYGLEEITP